MPALQLNILSVIAEAERLRDEGIQLAADHADSPAPYNWTEKAYKAAIKYLNAYGSGWKFQTEDMRAWIYNRSLVTAPSSERAFGAIILSLKRDRLVKCIGIESVINPKAHRANASVWEII